MQQYLDLMRNVMNNGTPKSDRTGTGTLSVTGRMLRFNLGDGFPLLTTKKLPIRSIVNELFWFLSGNTNVNWLQERGVTIWDEWADENGDLGPIYGKQWRSFSTPSGGTIDQISQVVESIKHDPYSRRHIVTSWNPSDLKDMALLPCHCLFMFTVTGEKLSCHLFQRSADVFLGLPFNIASYSLLTHMVAHQTGYEVGDFIWSGGDIHLYSNHIEQAKTQLERVPKALPKLLIQRKPNTLFQYIFDDFSFVGYAPDHHIKADVAV